jgi:GNT-I family protein
MKALSLCLWRRPAYTRMVLDSLARCPEIGGYVLFAGVDGGGCPGVLRELHAFSACRVVTSVRPEHIGCNQNTKLTLVEAFQASDYVIHLEDDTPLAPDGLRFFEWAHQFGVDPSVFTVSGWGILPKPDPHPDDPARVIRCDHFSCWTWATWRDRWQEMLKDWTTGGDMDTDASWDCQVGRIRGDRFQIKPVISRTTNIGSDLGTHRGDCLVEDWAGRDGFVPPKEFVATWLTP